jgi:glutaredoxin
VVTVTLYTKSGCDLCREARDSLEALAEEFPHTLVEHNIADDAEVFEKYKNWVPVVIIGKKRLLYPFSDVDLIMAFEAQV